MRYAVDRKSVKRYKNLCMALHAMSQKEHGAMSLAEGLSVSRATATSYINQLLDCGFITITDKSSRFVASVQGKRTNLKCGLWYYADMLADADDIADEIKSKAYKQLSFLGEL